jgi:hypothetical protein
MLCTSYQILFGLSNKEGHVARMGEKRVAYRFW